MLQKRLSIRVVWLLVQLSVRLAHANPSTFSITVYIKEGITLYDCVSYRAYLSNGCSPLQLDCTDFELN